MNYADIHKKIHEQVATVISLAALAAELRLRQNADDGDPCVRDALQAAASKLVPMEDLDIARQSG